MMFWLVGFFFHVMSICEGVDQSKFRTCTQTSFCRRHRIPINTESAFPNSIPNDAFHLDSVELVENNHILLLNLLSKDVLFQGTLSILSSGAVRWKMVEKSPLHGPRWTSDIVQDNIITCPWTQNDDNMKHEYVSECMSNLVVHIEKDPFIIRILYDGHEQITINTDNRLYFEHHLAKEPDVDDNIIEENTEVHEGKTIVDYGEDGLAIYEDGSIQAARATTKTASLDTEGLWEETFGSYTDTKPYGPSSVGVDIAFPQSNHLFGIPEHAADFRLKATRGKGPLDYKEPYRLYNLDVFEHDLDVPMALYGSIPVMLAHGKLGTVGVFWNNPTETFIDVDWEETSDASSTHWMSESGIIDTFFFLGPNAKDVMGQYASITGTPYLPPLFSLAYHQCRWNYKNEDDVAAVNAGFEEFQIPYDVLWLDIEHTDGKRYFTWDTRLFPTPVAMQQQLSVLGRKMVTIVDPHIKRDDQYIIHKEATELGLYVKKPDGKTDFDGWCWPGSSSYVDFTNEKARTWWASRFTLDKYIGSTMDLYTWNDMNEPSVFNGPEVSMQKDARNINGVEHREWHNLYGLYMQKATIEGLQGRGEKTRRGFVLSRAFYAGSQKYGAIWTGDNKSEWSHLKYATKMLLSMSVAGLSFVGADVGGFFGNPEVELLTRWYQAGAFQPFFRGHAHHDSKRREPYLLDETHRSIARKAILSRYAILPYLYTVFEESHVTGVPVMRPIWMEIPQDVKTWAIEDAFFLGEALMIHPVVEVGQREAQVYIPNEEAGRFFNYWTYVSYLGGSTVTIEAPLTSIPVLHRGGTILCTRPRVRRSSALMHADPYTMIIALSTTLSAVGEIFLDDGDSIQAPYLRRRFTYASHVLSSDHIVRQTLEEVMEWPTIERIVVLGLGKAPLSIMKDTHESVVFAYDDVTDALTIRKPLVTIGDSWHLTLQF